MNSEWDIIADAIQGKLQVTATYHGLHREMCPHVLGFKLDKKTGARRAQCLFYQFAGESSRGLYDLTDPRACENWRCLFLDELSDVASRPGPWFSISPHTRPQRCVDEVSIEVSGWV